MMSTAKPEEENPMVIQFLPLHKRAFGTATGLAAALMLFVITAITTVIYPEDAFDLGLLANYFTGYSITWSGAFIGAAWAGFVGFVMGWFLAFARNFLVAITILYVRARVDYSQARDLLDHI